MPLNVEKIRQNFPILKEKVHGKPLVYLDNAASSQKPQIVIDAISHYYKHQNSNVHRGIHYLSAAATELYEEVRNKAQKFINAKHNHEIIFTRGTTEGINLVATAFGRFNIKQGDKIIISEMEHHSNIVPWQMLCKEKGAILRIIPINDNGEIIFEEYVKLLSEKAKLVAVNHVSNTLGTINPVKKIIDEAHKWDIPVLIDGAQAAPHLPIDVQKLDCDFYTLSSHKMYGPTGIGILYGKEKWLNSMPPYQGGGDMIKSVSFEATTYNDLPHKFEAGTPNIADTIAFGTAIDYINTIGLETIAVHEEKLLQYATEKLTAIEGLKIIGTAQHKAAVISFVIEGLHPSDIGTILDQQGIAIRTGHHCTQPLMDRFKVSSMARASFAMYNTVEEIDVLVEGIKQAMKMLK